MLTRDIHIDPAGNLGRKAWVFQIPSVAASQAGVTVRKIVPGFPFLITAVRAWAVASHANARVDVKKSNTSVLTATFLPGVGAAAPIAGSLTGTTATLQGSATDSIDVAVTTGVGETMTDVVVTVQIRPRTFRGDV